MLHPSKTGDNMTSSPNRYAKSIKLALTCLVILVVLQNESGNTSAKPSIFAQSLIAHRNPSTGPIQLFRSNVGTDAYDMAIDLDGNIHIVYMSLPSDTGVFYAHSLDRGVTWSQPRRLDDVESDGRGNKASLSIDSANNVHVVWEERRLSSTTEIYYSCSSDHGLSWTPAVVLSYADETVNINPSITSTASEVIAVWCEIANDGEAFARSRNYLNPDWTSITRAINTSYPLNDECPALGAKSNGTAIAVAQPGEYVILVNSKNGVWNRDPTLFDNTHARQRILNVDYNPIRNRFFVSWSAGGTSATPVYLCLRSALNNISYQAGWSGTMTIPTPANISRYHTIVSENSSLWCAFATTDSYVHLIQSEDAGASWSSNQVPGLRGEHPVIRSRFGIRYLLWNRDGWLQFMDLSLCGGLLATAMTDPQDGALSVPQPIVLNWEDQPAAVNYRVRVAINDSLSTPLIDTSVSTDSLLLSALPALTTCFWSIQSIGECYEGPTSEVFKFTTDSGGPPGAINGIVTNFNGTVPLNNTILTLRRNGADVGTAVSDASGRYEFTYVPIGMYSLHAELANYTAWDSIGIIVANLDTTTVNIHLLLDISAPNWCGPWFDFSLTGNIMAAWNKHPMAARYSLELSMDPLFADTVITYQLPTVTDTIFSLNCLDQQTWYFRVRALAEPGDTGRWSSTRNVLVSHELHSEFTLGQDDWSFPNFGDYVWPSSWYSKFGYLDPAGGYPRWFQQLCAESGIDPNGATFPDWPLYAEFFARSPKCCYEDTNYFKPKRRVVSQWIDMVMADGQDNQYWQGSCGGFSFAGLLMYGEHVELSSVFGSGTNSLNSVAWSDVHPKIGWQFAPTAVQPFYEINKYQMLQSKKDHGLARGSAYARSNTISTVNDVVTVLRQTRDELRPLILDDSDYVHSVVPYRVRYLGCGTGIVMIDIYDNADSSDSLNSVYCYLNENRWSYESAGWGLKGGTKGLYLDENPGEYIVGGKYRLASDEDDDGTYVYGNSNLLVTVPTGDSLGYRDGRPIVPTDSSTGCVIISPEGGPKRNRGVWVATDSFSIVFDAPPAQPGRFSAYTDSSAIRLLVDGSAGHLSTRFDMNDLNSMSHVENESTTLSWEGIREAADSEIVVMLSEMPIVGNDSISVSWSDENTISVANHSAASRCELQIVRLSTDGELKFRNSEVPLLANARHSFAVLEAWAIDSLLILIDSGFTGHDTDTLVVEDETLELECCQGLTGNVNKSIVETPDLSDLSLLIAHLIVTPKPSLPCMNEANVNGSTSVNPDLSDLSLLIAYLTVSPKPTLPSCP